MKILFLTLILTLSFIQIHSYIKIPLKLYPNQIFNVSNPSNTFNSMINTQLYAKIDIGTPKQTILLSLELEKNEFYISRYNPTVSTEKYTIYNFQNFNEKLSSSFSFSKDAAEDVYYNTNFLLAIKAKDIFYFGEQKGEIEFYSADHLTEEIPGELGLQIEPIDDLNSAFDNSNESFLKKIKNNRLIENYIWTIVFNPDSNNKNEDAYLYIGDYLHNIDNSGLIYKNTKFKKDSLSSVNAYIWQKTVKPEFEMNKLILYRNNDPNDIIQDIKYGKNYLRVKLDYNLGGIQGSEIIRNYLETNIFTEENKCHKDSFYYRNKYFFYYCDKNKDTINKIKKNFPTLQFIHQDFNFNFMVSVDDIIVEKDDYVYFLIFFNDFYKYDWRLGRPFLNKYNFMIDQDGKKVLFYSEKEEIVLPGLKKKSVVFLLIFLIIVFLLLGILLGRKIYKTKMYRKHANILEDNFDYTIQDESNNKEIEMSKKLYE